MKRNVRAFSLNCRLVWGLGLCALTWWIIAFDGASIDPTFFGSVYRGYALTPTGSAIGLIWGLADGFVGGAIFAWLYNRFASAK